MKYIMANMLGRLGFLAQELDFKHEAANAERCRKNLASGRSHVRGRVAVSVPHSLKKAHA